MRYEARSLCISIGLCALFSILISGAHAANFPVTVMTDTNSGGLAGAGPGAAGDLRSQILAANASGGADTITFVCGGPPCTITLSGPLPPITESLTIDGGTPGDIVISARRLDLRCASCRGRWPRGTDSQRMLSVPRFIPMDGSSR